MTEPRVSAGSATSSGNEKRPFRLLIGLTGSAGLMSMSKYLELFRARLKPEIRIILTSAADKIVPKNTWLALGPAGVYGDEDWVSAEHVSLALWPDAILVAPCTANTLASVATGRCDNLLTATIICTHAPVIIAPNMNPLMLSNPAVQRNLATIKADGATVVDMEPSLIYAFGTRDSREDLGMASPETLLKVLMDSGGETAV
jgi:phosphopantothenoylcysteine decarboxylase/phosphopantothenate--cysteine ligase